MVVVGSSFVIREGEGEIKSSPCLKLDITLEDGDKVYNEFLSAGNLKDFAPSKDGNELIPVGSRTSLNAGCKLAMFCRSLLEAGMPEAMVDSIGSNAKCLVGAQFYVVRQTVKARREGQKDYTVLIVDKVESLPGETSTKGKGSGKGKAKAAAAAAPATGDLDAKTEAILKEILEKQGKPIAKKSLPSLVFAATQDKDILDVAFDDAFLGGKSRPWTYEDSTLTLK